MCIISKHVKARLPCVGKGKDLLLPSLQELHSEDTGENESVLPN